MRKITDEQKQLYLEHLADTGLIIRSTREAGFSYMQLEKLRRDDQDFYNAELEAQKSHGEIWERECRRRGIEGWEEPVFHEGQKCGTKRRFSDRMLELGLKRHCPEYREKMQVDVAASGGVLVVGLGLSKDDWLEKYAEKKSDVD